MFLGHDFGKALNSYIETDQQFLGELDGLPDNSDEPEDLGFVPLLIRLAAITGLLTAITIMIALFVRTFTHYY